MTLYAFVLGRDSELSQAEILCFLEKRGMRYALREKNPHYLLIETDALNPTDAVMRLGGTIKIAEEIERINATFFVQNKMKVLVTAIKGEKEQVIKELKKKGKEERVKIMMKQGKISELSAQEYDLEILIHNKKLFRVVAVSHPKEYKNRDEKRPVFDPKKGISIRLAKILINLSEAEKEILDPFCGLGTILQEAAIMGYACIGLDMHIDEAKANMAWLNKEHNVNVRIVQGDARKLTQYVSSVECIVTEPYLGPYLKRKESMQKIETTKKELHELYDKVLENIRKIVQKRVVIIFPSFTFQEKTIELKIPELLKRNKFTIVKREHIKNPIFYKNENNRIGRWIYILEKAQ